MKMRFLCLISLTLATCSGFAQVLTNLSYTLTISNCCSLIANQLDKPGGNTLANIMPSLPCSARFMKYSNATHTWVTTTYAAANGWADGSITLNPGEGAFLCPCCSNGFTVTFTGDPHPDGTNFVSSFGLVSRLTNAVGTYETITKHAPTDGAMVWMWSCSGYVAYVYYEGLGWYDQDSNPVSEPRAKIGEALWIDPTGSGLPPPACPDFPCPCVPPPPGLSAWWPFDETTGPTANDLAGFNNQGTYFGNPISAAGMVSNALCFNGTSDFVLVTNHPEINFTGACTNGTNTAQSFTIDAWIRANAAGLPNQALLDKRVNANTTPRGYNLYLYSGRLGFQLADGSNWHNDTCTNLDLRDGQWHFIAVTVARCGTNGNVVALYVDGAEKFSDVDSLTGDLDNSADLAIGRPDPYHGFGYFSGCLDELEFFKRVLTVQEIQDIFNAGSAGKCKTNCLGALVLTCATNKTVYCPTDWVFDDPTVVDPCCGSQYTLTFTTITNGTSCSNSITRTWQVTDCLNCTATCSQTVTVLHTLTPVITCAGDKTVQSGAPWTFDPPSVSAQCCSPQDLTVISFPPQTNGNCCTQLISQVWQATCCTHSATCTQTVMVLNSTAPTIICPTNQPIVALDTNCELRIPLVRPHATDHCTPASQLVYSQTPPAGSLVPGPCQTVTVTVSNACGKSSQCQVVVCGRDKTRPKLVCPASINVSNCLVPNALLFVSATDNCTPSNQLVFIQSPPANTSLCSGVNSVTVTVTDLAGNSATHIIPLEIIGQTSFLANLFNTGVDNNRAWLPDGTTDPHYALPIAPPGTKYTQGAGTAVAATYPWDMISPVSKWIGPTRNYSGSGSTYEPAGDYTYVLNFTLPSGAIPSTASISGRWAADNGAGMYLNSVASANKASSILTPDGYAQWTSFTIPPGHFMSGPNTLYFVVTNDDLSSDGSFTGLKVEFTNAVANCCTCTPPSIVWMTPGMSLPMDATAVITVTAQGTPPLAYQWYHNGMPVLNGGHDSGANTSTLKIQPLSTTDAGMYWVVISNPCGQVTNASRNLVVSTGAGWPWPWAMWEFAQPEDPFAATVGPDLILAGTNSLAIASGTTAEFGLPELGGQVAPVMYVPALPGDTTIQLPLIAPPGSNSVREYTLIMDFYCPSDSSGTTRTLFANGPLPGGLTWTIDADNILRIVASVGGTNIQVASPAPITLGEHHRTATVLLEADTDGDGYVSMYLDGQVVAGATLPAATPGIGIDWNNSPPTLLSSPAGTAGNFYVSSVQFHAIAMTPEMLASLGSPDNGPIPANDTSVGPQPVLSATMSNGIVNLTWTGSSYVLQEAAGYHISSFFDVWLECALPFTESLIGGNIVTTAVINPSTEGPSKFYRLIFRP